MQAWHAWCSFPWNAFPKSFLMPCPWDSHTSSQRVTEWLPCLRWQNRAQVVLWPNWVVSQGLGSGNWCWSCRICIAHSSHKYVSLAQSPQSGRLKPSTSLPTERTAERSPHSLLPQNSWSQNPMCHVSGHRMWTSLSSLKGTPVTSVCQNGGGALREGIRDSSHCLLECVGSGPTASSRTGMGRFALSATYCGGSLWDPVLTEVSWSCCHSWGAWGDPDTKGSFSLDKSTAH